MPRPLRFIPQDSVVEVTARTVGSRFLLRPGPTANDLISGVLGRAQHLFGVRIFAVAAMSNHLHAVLGVDDAAQLAAFMQHALANIAKEIGRLHRWQGPFWSRRYRAIVVADPESQVSRLRYVLCQGLREGLVDRVDRWPGVSSFATLVRGKALRGTWYDRTAAFESQRRGKAPDPRVVEQVYEVKFSPLPAAANMPPDEYRRFVGALVQEDEAAVAAARAAGNKGAALGARRVLEQDPHAAPAQTKHSPAPLVHAASRAVRVVFMAAYRAFWDAFRAAAVCLRLGKNVLFPEGAFPPSGPFVHMRATAG